MAAINFKEWQFDADVDFTREVYGKASHGSAQGCKCDACKNYIINRENSFPPEIKQLFTQLGIDYTKESEVSHFVRDHEGMHHYGGWFHFKGKFKGKNCNILYPRGGSTNELTPITEYFSIGFHHNNALSFFPMKEGIVQVEFWAIIPWTIDPELEPQT